LPPAAATANTSIVVAGDLIAPQPRPPPGGDQEANDARSGNATPYVAVSAAVLSDGGLHSRCCPRQRCTAPVGDDRVCDPLLVGSLDATASLPLSSSSDLSPFPDLSSTSTFLLPRLPFISSPGFLSPTSVASSLPLGGGSSGELVIVGTPAVVEVGGGNGGAQDPVVVGSGLGESERSAVEMTQDVGPSSVEVVPSVLGVGRAPRSLPSVLRAPAVRQATTVYRSLELRNRVVSERQQF
jgi:hypothetical protein